MRSVQQNEYRYADVGGTRARFADYHQVFRRSNSRLFCPLNILDEIVRQLQGTILDIGTADGFKLESLLGDTNPTCVHRILALEPSSGLYTQAKRRFQSDERVTVQNLALEEADLLPASFDAILMFEVLEHLHCPEGAVQRVCQLLKPGGHFMGSTPNKWVYRATAYLAGKRPDPTHLKEMTTKETIELLSRYFTECQFLGFLPCMFLFRRFPQLSRLNRYFAPLFLTRSVYFLARKKG